MYSRSDRERIQIMAKIDNANTSVRYRAVQNRTAAGGLGAHT